MQVLCIQAGTPALIQVEKPAQQTVEGNVYTVVCVHETESQIYYGLLECAVKGNPFLFPSTCFLPLSDLDEWELTTPHVRKLRK